MKTLGIAVTMKKRPIVTLALVEGRLAEAGMVPTFSVEETFEIPLNDHHLAADIGEAAKAVRGRVRSLSLDAVVVRRADRPQRVSNAEGPRKRLLIEGAIASAAYAEVQATYLMSGKDCGATCSLDKSSLERLVEGVADSKFKVAVAAGVAAVAKASS